MSVMVVVPALAEGEQSDPEAVLGSVGGEKPARPPHVGGRVYEPGGVQPDDRAEEDSPQNELPSTDSKQHDAEDRDGNPMPAADPDVELVLAELRHIRKKIVRIVVRGGAGQ